MRKRECCHLQTRRLNHTIIKKFCHICKTKFHGFGDSNDDSDYDSDEEFSARKFHGNAEGLDGDDGC